MKPQEEYMVGNVISYQYYSDRQLWAKVKEIRTHDFLVEVDGRQIKAADWCTDGVLLLEKYLAYLSFFYDSDTDAFMSEKYKAVILEYDIVKSKKRFFLRLNGEKIYIKYLHVLQNMLTILESDCVDIDIKELKKI